jgi:hypothetical protein
MLGLPVFNDHQEDKEQLGEISNYILKHNNNGTADLIVNLKLSDNGYKLAKQGGHVSAGCVFSG